MRRGVVMAAALLWAAPAAAQEQLNLDFFQGPVVNSSRVTGLGGAYVGVAEGADGHLINPSSLAVRYPYTLDDWFDWDFAFSTLNDLQQDGNQIDRSGRKGSYDNAFFLEAGVAFRLGRLGLGLQFQSQSYDVAYDEPGARLRYNFSLSYLGLGAAYAFWDGELVIGALLTGGNAELIQEEVQIEGEEAGPAESIRHSGGGINVSALWAPVGRPWRLGATARNRIDGVIEGRNALAQDGFVQGEVYLGRLRVPDRILVPWQLGIGGSYMVGPRRYNPRPTYGAIEGDLQRVLERRYLLFAADLILTGPAPNATGTQAFLQGEVQQSGQHASLSPRLGVESELWEDLITLRGGAYYEPSRFDNNPGRVHLTGGGDLHVAFGWDWKISAVLDIADRYSNFGLGVGFWH
jgi:hypothetical protein